MDIEHIAEFNATVERHLGLRATDFYEPKALLDDWIRPGLDRSESVPATAYAFCEWFREKHDLHWLTGNTHCVVCGHAFDVEDRGVAGRAIVCSERCLYLLAP